MRSDFDTRYSYFPSITKPIIAAVNGPAVGLGLILALYCDLRFATRKARFGTAFARRGLIAEFGTAWILSRLIGPARALDLLLSARMVDAAEAEKIRLVDLPGLEMEASLSTADFREGVAHFWLNTSPAF